MEGVPCRARCSSPASAQAEAPVAGAWLFRLDSEIVIAARRIEKLRREHPVEGFDCGREELNRYLLRHAWQNQQAGASQTYIGMVGDAIVGFYTLAVGQVAHEDTP